MRMSYVIIVYRQSNKSKSVQLSQALHGYRDHSNYGKYVYRRKGLLDRIPFQKVFNGVFIVKSEDAGDFIRLLEKYGAVYYAGQIEFSSQKIDIP